MYGNECYFLQGHDTDTHEPLNLSGEVLKSVNCLKILGVKITDDLKWDVHITDVIKRASGRLFMLTILRRFGLTLQDLKTIYIGFIRPLVEYAVPVWHPGLTEQQHYALERVQKRALKIILGNNYCSYADAMDKCQLQELRKRRNQICIQFADKLLKDPKFREWLPRFRGEISRYNLRDANLLSTPRIRTQRYANSPIPYMVSLWNKGSSDV